MKLYIVRHGQTNYNVQDLINYEPQVNVYLTENGASEASNVSEQLASVPFDVIYVSELPRTHQTAQIIRPKDNFIMDARLNDINNGFEGRSVSEFKALRNQSSDPYNFRYDEASESSQDVYNRVNDFLNDIRTKNYESVLIVTSAHVWRHFRNILDHRNPSTTLHESIPNGEILIREI